jgi:hypothetical protein
LTLATDTPGGGQPAVMFISAWKSLCIIFRIKGIGLKNLSIKEISNKESSTKGIGLYNLPIIYIKGISKVALIL